MENSWQGNVVLPGVCSRLVGRASCASAGFSIRGGAMTQKPRLNPRGVVVSPTLSERAQRIRALIRGNIIEIGRELIAAKAEIDHGKWLSWLEDEFDWTSKTAENYMNVTREFGSLSNLGELPITVEALYLLSTKSVPQKVRDEAIARTSGGERITKEVAQQMVRGLAEPEQIEQEALAEPEQIDQEALADKDEKVVQLEPVLQARQGEESAEANEPEQKREVDPIANLAQWMRAINAFRKINSLDLDALIDDAGNARAAREFLSELKKASSWIKKAQRQIRPKASRSRRLESC